jgi:hypothetical protein
MRPDRYQDSFANDAENDAGVPLRLERVFSLSKSCYQITSFRIGVALHRKRAAFLKT